MVINRLSLKYFGRFQNQEIELKAGINLIYGENEAGKSTIHTFIKGMLFGIERARGRAVATKEDIYQRYLPWDYPGAYGGSMDIRVGDKSYRIERSFHTNDRYFRIINLETGREVILNEGHISELIPGLTESTYRNTISVEQLKASTDAELASKVQNYIANFSITKSNEVNVSKAVKDLVAKKKSLEKALDQKEILSLEVLIKEGYEKEEKLEALTKERQEKLRFKEQLLKEKGSIEKVNEGEEARRMEQLPAILENFKNYCELNKEVDDIKNLKTKYQDKIEELKQTNINNSAASIRKPLLSQVILGIASIVSTVICLIILGVNTAGIISSIACILIGLAIILVINYRYISYRRSLEEIISNKKIILVNDIDKARDQLDSLTKKESEIEDRLDSKYEEIMKYTQYFLVADELSEDTMIRLERVIRDKRQELNATLLDINRKLSDNQLDIERFNWDIDLLEDNEDELNGNNHRYEEIIQRQEEDRAELEAVNLALTTIQGLSIDIHDSFGKELNLSASTIIRDITNEKYDDIKIDENLDIKVGWNGNYIPMERLSAGTIDQLYLSLRLAVSKLLMGDDTMPIILDDSFALYDEARTRAALKRLIGEKQVIIFTCHQRERKILDEMNISYNYIEI
ncbi:MAG: AAA family ATPase [Clostridiales bacterium]|nr:AAA family ATPase [Clostridiales bacterium]